MFISVGRPALDELSCLTHHPVLVVTVLLGGLEKCPDVRLVNQFVIRFCACSSHALAVVL